VPIFPEIAELLAERLEQAEDGDEMVLPMLKGKSRSLARLPVLRAAKAAGCDYL
jgi:hypothetical protein